MKRVIWLSLVVLLVALTAAALGVCPGSMKCPLHDGWIANYTSMRMMDGVFVGVYHCPYASADSPSGHEFIVRCGQ
jgi:hypothetical protein